MEVQSVKGKRMVLGHNRGERRIVNVRPGESFNLACLFFDVRVASVLLRPGDFVRVTCLGRTAIVFNSFLAFNRGTINLRRGEFVNFTGRLTSRRHK